MRQHKLMVLIVGTGQERQFRAIQDALIDNDQTQVLGIERLHDFHVFDVDPRMGQLRIWNFQFQIFLI